MRVARSAQGAAVPAAHVRMSSSWAAGAGAQAAPCCWASAEEPQAVLVAPRSRAGAGQAQAGLSVEGARALPEQLWALPATSD